MSEGDRDVFLEVFGRLPGLSTHLMSTGGAAHSGMRIPSVRRASRFEFWRLCVLILAVDVYLESHADFTEGHESLTEQLCDNGGL